MPRSSDLPPYLSVSQITTYLQCPRKYRFRYVDRLEPECRNVALSFGSAVHATIAWWIEERMAGRLPPSEAVHRTFRADWTAELAIDIPLVTTKEPTELLELGVRLVDAFADRFREETFTGTEIRFEVELLDRRSHRVLAVPLVGFVDFTTDRVLGEVKTASRKCTWRHWELQLVAYRIAARAAEFPQDMLLVQLTKGKARSLEADLVPVSASDEWWFVEVARGVYDSAARGAFHPAPSHQCTMCEYQRMCRR